MKAAITNEKLAGLNQTPNAVAMVINAAWLMAVEGATTNNPKLLFITEPSTDGSVLDIFMSHEKCFIHTICFNSPVLYSFL